MLKSLERDPLENVLLKPHLDALDRRVRIILKTVFDCIEASNGRADVVIEDDGF
jgi:hypothetical protein